jgi:transposase-like protein
MTTSASATTLSLHQTKPTLACPYCRDRHIIKKGVRKNKYSTVQLFACRRCKKKFTPLVTKHKSFPLRAIIEALTQYNRAGTRSSTPRRSRAGSTVSG